MTAPVPETTRTVGADLTVGNMIRVWWRPNVDVITRFEDYTGPLADLWPEGARIAWFASGKGMTLPNDTWYEKVHVTP